MPRRRYQPMERGYMTTGEYERGYEDGYFDGRRDGEGMRSRPTRRRRPQKPKRKGPLTKWQKFMKSPKSQIKYKSGKDKGKLNLKAMGRAYRKKHGTKKK